MAASVGIQLYTVRDLCQADFVGTVRAIAEMGYHGVEFAGKYGGMPPRELARFLNSVGLQAAGVHIGVDHILNPASEGYAYARALNCGFVTTSLCGEVAKDWMATIDRMAQAASVAFSQGFTFTYHNHAQEFGDVNGVMAQDRVLARPSLIQFELDTYWIKKGGQDPAATIRRFTGRSPQIHLKDMDKEDGSFAEVGHGALDMPAILKAASDNGARWLIVEQDKSKRSPLESAKMSIEFLKQAGVVG